MADEILTRRRDAARRLWFTGLALFLVAGGIYAGLLWSRAPALDLDITVGVLVVLSACLMVLAGVYRSLR